MVVRLAENQTGITTHKVRHICRLCLIYRYNLIGYTTQYAYNMNTCVVESVPNLGLTEGSQVVGH